MNEQAIKKLKNRFIGMATVSFVLVMFFMGGLIYIASSSITSNEVSDVLDSIISNDGYLPKNTKASGLDTEEDLSKSTEEKGIIDQIKDLFTLNHFYNSPEYAYSARYFTVVYNSKGKATEVRLNHITSVDEKVAVKYANKLKNSGSDFGSFGNYYYKVKTNKNGSSMVVIMDCTSQIAMNKTILSVFLILLVVGILIAYIVMRIFAGRLVAPEVENAEMQKSFITNASHELKTPVSVIRANTELIEAMNGENEWTQSTMRQVVRLQSLINNLVMVTRSEENSDATDRIDIDVSSVIKDTVDTFKPVAEQDDKKLEEKIPDGVVYSADEAEIRQLVSLLVDNAIKYCDDGGNIEVGIASRKGKRLNLWVTNDYAEGEGVDYSKFFDRFYREDKSHNIDKGGFGIGLSIADNLVRHYHGKIDVAWKDGRITFTCRLN